MLPLVTEKNIALTHLIVCSFHINLNGEIHLNDYPPDNPLFYTLWNETVVMQEAGVKVMGMVGGAASGSFTSSTLDSTDDATFEHYYGQLHDVIAQYGLQGMDLDVEQSMSQVGITRLVTRLYTDFGDDFIITLAPVASALYVDEYGQIGGIMGWEYFNSDPGGTAEPWEWAQEMTQILRPNYTVALTITTEAATILDMAFRASVGTDQSGQLTSVQSDGADIQHGVDYFAMINA
ncbi:hypothetical protein SLS53_008402 [Cytospora paraplurivora]|uniref:GH18 domain-containing protein n=1 Tax=Cytospora paraplurivora TaxID=2898453 RepID=A0AAN9U165_9PEZI